ncbi:hypothetical protein N9N00_05710 [Schleiferiaceae bacterium]|nr:hypothetical protein [Schleiferiaceae bacterium]
MIILVLFGTIEWKFKTLESFIQKKIPHFDNYNWIIQAGFSFENLEYLNSFQNVEVFNTISTDALKFYYSKADIIITHCGTGSIFSALEIGKIPFVIPRLFQNAEHVDNHQEELFYYLLGRGFIKDLRESSNFSNVSNLIDIDVSGKNLTKKIWRLLKHDA